MRTIASNAALTHDSMFSDSFRHGITTDTSGGSASSEPGIEGGALVGASVLIG